MLAVAHNLAPIFLIIVIGVLVAQRGIVRSEQWVGVERLFYYVLFPALIVHAIATADLGTAPVLKLTAAMLASLIAMVIALLALRPLVLKGWGESGPAFTSLFQGALRWNSFGAVAIVGGLYDRSAVSLAAIALAAIIPFVNVASVAVLAKDGAGATPGLASVVGALARNPLIWSPAIGILIALSGVSLPKPVVETLRLLSQPTVALGLLLVGAGLDWRAALRPTRMVWLASVLKLILMPAMMVGLGRLLGLDGTAIGVLAVCGAVPTASAAYVLARQMGGDADLMSRIVAVETLLAFLTMPVAIWASGEQ